MKKQKLDVEVIGGGTQYIFTPLTKAAKAWAEEHVRIEDWQWMGAGFAVDHRYALDLAQGMREDGLAVR